MSKKFGEFLPPAEKRNSGFLERGKLTEQETRLSRILDSFIEKQRISLNDFVDRSFASKDIILEDGRRVREMQQKIEADRENISTTDPERGYAESRGYFSEQVTIYGLQAGEWLGEDTKVIIASTFDDYFNGVDCIAELDDMHHVAIGIDTTLSEKKIIEKLKRIRDKILEGKLTQIKYFKSKDTLGTLENVPLTVIGANLATNAEMAELAYDLEVLDEQHNADEIDEAKDKLRKHKAQFKILFEIEMELVAFEKFAETNNEREVAKKLKAMRMRIQKIIAEKANYKREIRDALFSEAKKDSLFKVIEQTIATHFGDWQESEIMVAKIP